MALGFIKNFLDHAAGFFGDIHEKFVDLTAEITGTVKEQFEADPKLKIISAGIALAVVLVIAGMMLILTRNSRSRRMRDSDAVAELFRMELPAEELFLGDEPDFLPEVLLEREQREEWTADDARPYWIDPADEGDKIYEDMIGVVVDRIMERIP
jgi:hypothetical protein